MLACSVCWKVWCKEQGEDCGVRKEKWSSSSRYRLQECFQSLSDSLFGGSGVWWARRCDRIKEHARRFCPRVSSLSGRRNSGSGAATRCLALTKSSRNRFQFREPSARLVMKSAASKSYELVQWSDSHRGSAVAKACIPEA